MDSLNNSVNNVLGNINAMKGVRVILCPTLDLAKNEAEKYGSFSTVEAEYGNTVVEGSPDMGPWATLAHHGPRADKPAPCIWNTLGVGNVSPKLPERILVSHLDLDTIGGIGLILGYFSEEEQPFWEAAAMIDVKGPHHVNECTKEARAQLRAFWAYNEKNHTPRFPRDSVTDITDFVANYFMVLNRIVKNDSDLLAAGEKWDSEVTAAVNNCLVYESKNIRAFAGGLFTASSYLGRDNIVRPCTVSYSTKTRAITLAFEDGGKKFNAAKILQELYGSDAGGREGIAGTPRGEVFDVFDLTKVIKHVEALLSNNE